MDHTCMTLLRLSVAALLSVAGPTTARAAHRPPPAATELEHAAPSIDVLVDRFLAALSKKDRKSLQRLRVTKREYIDIIMPGTAEPGHTQRKYPEEKATYWWDTLNEKSLYSEIALLNGYGGQKYKVRDVSWAKGVQQFAGYTGYAQLRLVVEDDEGESHEIDTGSVAEVHGRYKFVSYVRD